MYLKCDDFPLMIYSILNKNYKNIDFEFNDWKTKVFLNETEYSAGSIDWMVKKWNLSGYIFPRVTVHHPNSFCLSFH